MVSRRSFTLYPRERVYFAIIVAVSVIVYATLIYFFLEPFDGAEPAAKGGYGALVIYVPILALISLLSHAYAIGRLRGNGIRVTDRQLPEVDALVKQHAALLGLTKLPAVYVVQAGGVLNAFAIKFFSRPFVVLYSDVVALAMEEGQGALGFVVAHELGHIRRGHLRYRWLTIPGRMIPYLGTAYSRACEYTCDRFAAKCEPADAVAGLLVLAAGRSLYRSIDAAVFAEQVKTEASFWVRRVELASSHPILPKRVAALLAAGIPRPVQAPSGEIAPGREGSAVGNAA